MFNRTTLGLLILSPSMCFISHVKLQFILSGQIYSSVGSYYFSHSTLRDDEGLWLIKFTWINKSDVPELIMGPLMHVCISHDYLYLSVTP